MKKLTLIFLAMMALMLVMMPAVMAEPVTAEPDAYQMLTKEVLTTQVGMILVASILTQGIKRVFLRNAGTETVRTVAFVVSLAVVIISKLILATPFEIADVLIIPGNAVIVWLSAMKAYEQTLGTASTPAGNTHANIN